MVACGSGIGNLLDVKTQPLDNQSKRAYKSKGFHSENASHNVRGATGKANFVKSMCKLQGNDANVYVL
jgi:hypothetical protein